MSTIPLGKRLESLEPDEPTDVLSEMQSQKKLKKMPKTGSMEVLLSQYLQTNDYNQIDNVLTIHDERVGLMFVHLSLDCESNDSTTWSSRCGSTLRHFGDETGSKSSSRWLLLCWCVEGLFFVAMDQNSAPLSQFFYDVGTWSAEESNIFEEAPR